MERPSSTAPTMVEKLSSARTKSEASLATSVPVMPMAMPMSAILRAGASLTPSPVMATTSPASLRSLTMSCLNLGSAREKTMPPRRSLSRMSRWASLLSLLNSWPMKLFWPRSSLSSKTPMSRQMASAVSLLSPVMTMTRTPAWRHAFMAALTSSRGGSCMATMPTQVSLDSTLTKVLGSRRSLADSCSGPSKLARLPRESLKAMPRQRSARLAMLLISAVMACRPLSERAILLPFDVMTWVQRSRRLSGAPLTRSSLAPLARVITDMDLRSRVNSRVATLSTEEANSSLAGTTESEAFCSLPRSFSTRTVSADSVGAPTWRNLPFSLSSMVDSLQSEQIWASLRCAGVRAFPPRSTLPSLGS
mmetsp:Transcript_16293/g.46273  ORF Transcript_16293/g.46273 Transcript_16293/m.46273 type:complete len:363 (-) Transcript_16293:1209-2297(-)